MTLTAWARCRPECFRANFSYSLFADHDFREPLRVLGVSLRVAG